MLSHNIEYFIYAYEFHTQTQACTHTHTQVHTYRYIQSCVYVHTQACIRITHMFKHAHTPQQSCTDLLNLLCRASLGINLYVPYPATSKPKQTNQLYNPPKHQVYTRYLGGYKTNRHAPDHTPLPVSAPKIIPRQTQQTYFRNS